MTLDSLNTQKIKLLNTKLCWRHSRNKTISLVPSGQNLQKSTFDKSNSHNFEQITCFVLIIALSLFALFPVWSTVAAPISYMYIEISLFSFSWLAKGDSRKHPNRQGLMTWNYQGIKKTECRNSGAQWKVEFPRVMKKKSCGMSMGLGFWPWKFQWV